MVMIIALLALYACEACLAVTTARRRGEMILSEVDRWIVKVDNFEEYAWRFLNKHNQIYEESRCFKDWKSRYTVSREVTRRIVVADQLILDGNFSTVSYNVAPSIELLPVRDFEAFASTKSAMDGVMKALHDENISTIGVYGMGGVGETTLVKIVGKQVKSEDHDPEDGGKDTRSPSIL
ncbi:putative disease resistance protein At4g10780 [Tasmannia lanceolata]|uniref:putative disease resistance protein At4g10780 n=1 Tax=Tasmannia lanceolata TaxID=3420 RepID=UPI00406438CF